MINIAIFDEHILTMKGIASLVAGVSDFSIVFACSAREQLLSQLKNTRVNILIYNMHQTSVRNFNLIVQLKIAHPYIKILVTSSLSGEDIVLKTLKAGASGFHPKEATFNELIEAIYTLRNGHDYFSNSITNLLLNRYINNIHDSERNHKSAINQLTPRQIEILKLWGESCSNQEIAERLFISIRTVETHKNHIMQKLNLKSTVDMVKFAIKNNIIEV
jgi:two-component system response regulator NreC